MLNLYRRFENNRVFSEEESWMLFKIAAIAEACGWTMLIVGIGIERYILPGNNVSVLLAGRVHGMLFLLYLIAVVGLYPTLKWSKQKSIIALLASVPPYGSLIFEQWALHVRNNKKFRINLNLTVYRILCDIKAPAEND